MSDLVGKVARGICGAYLMQVDYPGNTDVALENIWEAWEPEARAAILATLRGVREPSKEQLLAIEAVRQDPKRLIDGATCWDAVKLYTVMIDALIAETEAGNG